MRILPVSSGKGGVGKTTFALNLALVLSARYKTVLVDLDPGTSSVRNFMQMPVKKDLYHFFKKGDPIVRCLSTLNRDLDPENIFKGFSFLASPKDYIYEIIDFQYDVKKQLIRGINSLDADFVILDLRAGIDSRILDFIPFENSGILVFTPRIKAASFTAAEIIKASILRTVRSIISGEKLCVSQMGVGRSEVRALQEVLSDIEKNYDREDVSLLGSLEKIRKKRSSHGLLDALIRYVRDYKIYYVLNQFNSIEESVENVISPFVKQVTRRVCPSLLMKSLGWVVSDEEIFKSSQNRIPYFLLEFYRGISEKEKKDSFDDELRRKMGLKVNRDVLPEDPVRPVGPQNDIDEQIDLLKTMYIHKKHRDPVSNFRFIKKTLLALSNSSIHRLGMPRLQTRSQLLQAFFRSYYR